VNRNKSARRQIFVLTPEEKRALLCVVAALVLGLGTMFYRAHHPRSPQPTTAKEQHQAKIAAASAKARSRTRRTTPAPAPPTPEDDDEEQRE
jgi:hypothetical protein